MKILLNASLGLFGAIFATDLLLANCKVCKDRNLSGDCKVIKGGETVTLDRNFKDNVSSISLDNDYSLRFWTWNKEERGKRGIFYKFGGNYETTFNHKNSPEYWLNWVNDDIDTIRCEYVGDRVATLFEHPNLTGPRLHLRPNTKMNLQDIGLKDKISSVRLHGRVKLDYYTWNEDKNSLGWIEKDRNGRYHSSAGNQDNNPERWLTTNDNFDVVSAKQNIRILDVWGEGRIKVGDGSSALITGFSDADNINHYKQKISNGANAGKDIPNLLKVDNYDQPEFPVGDGRAHYVTLMGAPITEHTAKEMYRVLDKSHGVVILYGPSADHLDVFRESVKDNMIEIGSGFAERKFPFSEINVGEAHVFTFRDGPSHDEL